MDPVSDWKEHNIYDRREGGDGGSNNENDDDDDDDENAEATFRLFDRSDEEEPEIFDFDFDNKLHTTIRIKGYNACTTSTGLGIWSGAEALCHFLVQHPEYVRGKRVLELGAGTGLVSLVALALGASHVWVTDGDVAALSNMRYNVHTLNKHHDNSDNDTDNNEGRNGRIDCRQLIWGQGLDDFVKSNHISDHGGVDVILAADCLYMRPSVDPFWKTVHRLLLLSRGSSSSGDNESVLLYTNPSASQAPLEMVLETAQTHGFEQQEKETQLVVKGSAPPNDDDVVYVFRLTKQPS